MNRDKELSKEKNILEFLNKNSVLCKRLLNGKLKHLEASEYIYSADLAVDELGLDSDLVHQLVEDYVIQIVKSKTIFLDYLERLKKSKLRDERLDYTNFRELAHKNLGVARNLRIRDAEKFLKELMTKDDLDYLELCLEALIVCAIKLKPKCAYEAIKLIEVKNSI
ncbi:MAG: hypothetical protein U9Q29_02700 [Campylobacterota bacterium]|nr:hypothetical protein [Campylobacterota bacterium]